jgi:hypothetical protein
MPDLELSFGARWTCASNRFRSVGGQCFGAVACARISLTGQQQGTDSGRNSSIATRIVIRFLSFVFFTHSFIRVKQEVSKIKYSIVDRFYDLYRSGVC